MCKAKAFEVISYIPNKLYEALKWLFLMLLNLLWRFIMYWVDKIVTAGIVTALQWITGFAIAVIIILYIKEVGVSRAIESTSAGVNEATLGVKKYLNPDGNYTSTCASYPKASELGKYAPLPICQPKLLYK